MDKLALIINTLNHIHVAGKDDLSRMLGCIQELEKMREEQHDGAEDQQEQNV